MMISEYLNILTWVVPLFMAFIICEYAITNYRKLKVYKCKDLLASGTFAAGTFLLAPMVKALITVSLFFFAFTGFNSNIDGTSYHIIGYKSFEWQWYAWILCFLLDDLCFYWYHRLSHTVRFLWAAHIVHHSSEHFNYGTGIRNGWFTLFYKPLFYMWIPALGFKPEMVILCMGAEVLWQFQLHTKFVPRLGIFERFLNTHTLHQVHHAKNIEYLDKNHGGFLNLFDRLFGTYKELDESVEIKFGIVHDPKSFNTWTLLTHEYQSIWKDVRSSKNLKEALCFVFGAPGWSPDGSSYTVKQLQKIVENMNGKRSLA